MKRESVFPQVLLIILVTSSFAALGVQRVEAEPGTIYIRADGSIDPPTANVTTINNVTYTFTDNISFPFIESIDRAIVVERDNIIIDGAGYKLQGSEDWFPPSSQSRGIDLSGRTGVTIKNTQIKKFRYGIWGGTYCNITGNNITDNYDGIRYYYSRYNSIGGNNITNNEEGIYLDSAGGNSISGNNITNNNLCGIRVYGSNGVCISGNNVANNYYGIDLYGSSDNSVIGNNVTGTTYAGIWLEDFSDWNNVSRNKVENNYGGIWVRSSHNRFYYNYLINNSLQASGGSDDAWDNGYPSGGNYWSDYTTRYPSAQELNDSGLWDTPYVISSNEQDNYPLIEPRAPAPSAPVASFVYSPEMYVFRKPMASLPILFNAYASYCPDGDITTYEWDFGDGNITTIAKGSLVVHVYMQPGFYNVTLKVTDANLLYNTTPNTLTVYYHTDLNCDGQVNIHDVAIVAKEFGSIIGWYVILDLDKNGMINIVDVARVAKDYGKSLGQSVETVHVILQPNPLANFMVDSTRYVFVAAVVTASPYGTGNMVIVYRNVSVNAYNFSVYVTSENLLLGEMYGWLTSLVYPACVPEPIPANYAFEGVQPASITIEETTTNLTVTVSGPISLSITYTPYGENSTVVEDPGDSPHLYDYDGDGFWSYSTQRACNASGSFNGYQLGPANLNWSYFDMIDYEWYDLGIIPIDR